MSQPVDCAASIAEAPPMAEAALALVPSGGEGTLWSRSLGSTWTSEMMLWLMSQSFSTCPPCQRDSYDSVDLADRWWVAVGADKQKRSFLDLGTRERRHQTPEPRLRNSPISVHSLPHSSCPVSRKRPESHCQFSQGTGPIARDPASQACSQSYAPRSSAISDISTTAA